MSGLPNIFNDRAGPWFIARYKGECSECGMEIERGERVRFVDRDVVCHECGEDYDK